MQTTITITLKENESLKDAFKSLLGEKAQTNKPSLPPTQELKPIQEEKTPEPKKKTRKPKEEPEAETETQKDAGQPNEEIGFEDMRRVAKDKMNAGKRDGVNELIDNYSESGSLSGVPEDKRAEFLAKLEAL